MKRTKAMIIRFTDEELCTLTAKVKRTQLSREEFCRRILNGAEVKEAPSADVRSMLRELRRIGANVNEVQKRANFTGFLDAPQLRKDMDELRNATRLIVEAYSMEA